MKKLLATTLALLFISVLVLGCSQEGAKDDTTKEPPATQEAEAKDTTAMDSAAPAEEAADDAADESSDEAEGGDK